MRQVFRMRPWIFPPEPQAIQEIFVRYGVIREFAKGAVMEHGGKGDAAQVGFLTKDWPHSLVWTCSRRRISSLCLLRAEP